MGPRTNKMTKSVEAKQACVELGWVVTLQEVNIFFLSPRLEQPTRYRSVWSPMGGQGWGEEK